MGADVNAEERFGARLNLTGVGNILHLHMADRSNQVWVWCTSIICCKSEPQCGILFHVLWWSLVLD
jgi:hypothetical protein